MYDYLIVGAGLFGSVFAHEMTAHGRKCLVVDRRAHIGGNCFTEQIEGINVHRYGAHILHTSDEAVWKYVNQFAQFNNFVNSPVAIYNGELYNLPFNMNTFSRMWGIKTPAEARRIIDSQIRGLNIQEPKNLEEQALLLVGTDIYEKLVKGYTEKQWGRACAELPPFLIKRLPLRFTFDNNYFTDRWQGIPQGGYTQIFEKLLKGCDILLGTDYSQVKDSVHAEKTIYTGQIDLFFDYCFGSLEYRSLRFEDELIDCDNWQGNAVVNYTDHYAAYTRIIEHKHFEFGTQPKTIITREYPVQWEKNCEPYYPVNDERNNLLYMKYKKLAAERSDVFFCGRLGEYKYYNMDQIIRQALDLAKSIE